MYADNDKLLKEYQEGNKALSNVIVENNLGLVNYVLKGFSWAFNNNPNYQNIFDKEDLFQEGVLGLYDSLDKYDPELGTFPTHAISYIKQAIYCFYYDKGRVIRVPRWCRTEYNKVRKAEQNYIDTYKKEPSLKQLSKLSGVKGDAILELKRTFRNVSSLDQPLAMEGENEDINLADTIPDNTDFYTQADRKIILPELKKDLDRMIHDRIPDNQEAKAFISYFKDEKRSQTTIAEKCGISKGKLNRIIFKGICAINNKYQDELIEKYADVISSSIRRQREIDLMSKETRKVIQEVIKCSLQVGDSLTIMDKKNKMIQATVWEINREQIQYDYIDFNKGKGEYDQIVKRLWIDTIYDYRTEHKKVVEIRVKDLML